MTSDIASVAATLRTITQFCDDALANLRTILRDPTREDMAEIAERFRRIQVEVTVAATMAQGIADGKES